MKIYLLRHEKRSMLNPTFYSPLLVEGLEDANKLKYLLDKENINLIFSSPFKRVLQTIKPFCDMKKTNVNIEYSLYERITCASKSHQGREIDQYAQIHFTLQDQCHFYGPCM